MNTLNEGETVWQLKWAADAYRTSYSYVRKMVVSRNRSGKLFLKATSDRAYGRRGFGTLTHKIPGVIAKALMDGKIVSIFNLD